MLLTIWADGWVDHGLQSDGVHGAREWVVVLRRDTAVAELNAALAVALGSADG